MKPFYPGLVVLALLPATALGQDPSGSEFQVNSYTTNLQTSPAPASDGSGNFVVLWQSNGQDGSALGVFGQRFNATGDAQGSEFQVNSYTTSFQFGPSVASDANGDFVVVWSSGYQDGDQRGVLAQRFNASGVPQASEFRINSYTTSGRLGEASGGTACPTATPPSG